MTEEKLRQSYLRGYSKGKHSQAKKVYPEAENPIEKFFNEVTSGNVYREKILPQFREMAGYQDINKNGKFEFPPSGNQIVLLEDIEEAYALGVEDGLKDRPKLKQIDHR